MSKIALLYPIWFCFNLFSCKFCEIIMFTLIFFHSYRLSLSFRIYIIFPISIIINLLENVQFEKDIVLKMRNRYLILKKIESYNRKKQITMKNHSFLYHKNNSKRSNQPFHIQQCQQCADRSRAICHESRLFSCFFPIFQPFF